jgi:hypothetical protein
MKTPDALGRGWVARTLLTRAGSNKRSRMGLKRGVRAGQIGNAVKLPIVGHALENVCAEIFERDAGARYNILDGTRDEDVVGA